jgi:hypothetical protein
MGILPELRMELPGEIEIQFIDYNCLHRSRKYAIPTCGSPIYLLCVRTNGEDDPGPSGGINLTKGDDQSVLGPLDPKQWYLRQS